MFDCNLFQDLRADGFKREIIESIQQIIEEHECKIHEQAASLNVRMSPTTFNR